ncbi:MAG TPA: RND family transporter [Bacteroidetes bacterium]|nr:RND family transporter [Bacteroidota bacterium]
MRDGEFLDRYKWWIIGLSAVITLFFAAWLPKLKIDPDVTTMIPTDMEARINTDTINSMFGGTEMVILLFRDNDVLKPATLVRVRKIIREVKQLDGVTRTMSLFDAKNIRGEEGTIVVDPAVPEIPQTPVEIEKLRKSLLSNDGVKDVVLTPDCSMTAVYATIAEKADPNQVVKEIEKVVNNNPGKAKVFFGGMPVLMEKISMYINRDISILMPVAILLMILMLYGFFRQFRGVLLPLLVVAMTIVVTMGMIPVMGWKMTIITVLLPVMMIAIANNYGIHLVALYQELNAEGKCHSRKKLVGMIFHRLYRPVLLTGLTTVAGILGLLSHVLIPAKQLGVLAALGVAFALMMSLLLIPAIMLLLKMPPPKLAKGNGKKHFLEHRLEVVARGVVRHPKRVILGFVILFLVSGVGILFLKVDANVENFFPKKNPVRVSADLINKHFGGSEAVSVWFTGDCKDPALLNRLDRYAKNLKMEPDVGHVISLADVVKEMSKAVYDPGEAYYNRIPAGRNAIAQLFELYNMGGDPEDFEQIVDFDYRNTQMLVRVNSGSTAVINDVVHRIRKLTQNDPAFAGIGGYGYINARLSGLIIQGQKRSLALAVIVVALLVMLIFRSFRSGIFISVPLTGAMIILFGLMGYAHIYLDTATAMLSSIMIGVGVDYTIHFLWRYRLEKASGKSYEDAVYTTITTTGRGITFNAFSVMVGFMALLISSFTPIRFFGFLVVVSIASCLAGAMVLVPALILQFKPVFLEENQRSAGRKKRLIMKRKEPALEY